MKDMRELLKIERKMVGLLETEAEVSREDLDDALFYAVSMNRPQAKVKFEKLKRLYEFQQHNLEVRTPIPEAERVTAAQVEEARKKAILNPSAKGRVEYAMLQRALSYQEDRDAELAEIKQQDKQEQRELAKEQRVQSADQKLTEELQAAYKQQLEAKNAAFDEVNQ